MRIFCLFKENTRILTYSYIFSSNVRNNNKQYRAAKRYTPADGSLSLACQWCSHLANDSEVAPVMALLPFGHFR